MARLDRLAAVKDIAQIGAAIGREFLLSPAAHQVVDHDEPTLRAALAQLEDSGARLSAPASCLPRATRSSTLWSATTART